MLLDRRAPLVPSLASGRQGLPLQELHDQITQAVLQYTSRAAVPLAVTGCPPGRPDAHAPCAANRLSDAVAAPATSTRLRAFLPRICFLLRIW